MKKALLGSFCFALIACAPPTQFLKKTYPAAQLADKSVAVYPVVKGQVQVQNEEDFADDFEAVKEPPEQFLAKEINDKAAKYFAANFKNIRVESLSDSAPQALTASNSERIEDVINKEPFEIRVPKALYLESKGIKSKFVLVLDNAAFSRNLESSQSTSMMPAAVGPGGKSAGGGIPMTTTSSKQYIAFGVNYLIYDYEEKAVVGYGFAKGESTFSFAMTTSDWYKCMDNAFAKIKAFSPFK